MKPKLPPAAVAAYHERLAARNLREVATRRPPIVWEGVYDELYERGMAMLDASTSKEAPPAASRRRGRTG